MTITEIYDRLALTRRSRRPQDVAYWSWVFLIDARLGWFYFAGGRTR